MVWYGGNTPDDQTPPVQFPCKAEHRKQCSSCMTSQSSEPACVVFRIPKWMWNIPSSDLTAWGTFHLKGGGPKRKKKTQKKPEMSKSCRLYIHQWSLTAVVMYKQLCTTCIVLSPRCLHLARVPLWASTTKSRIVSSPICFLFSLLGLLVVAAQKTERESERGERGEKQV